MIFTKVLSKYFRMSDKYTTSNSERNSHDKIYIYEVNPRSWEDAKRIGKHLSQPVLSFVFRGQESKDWGLKTSLERALEKYVEDFTWAWFFEKEIIKKFKSRAHQYIQSPPKDQDFIEWLSIIQHYGGPTRLLDFSESFYISAFFAIDSATEDSSGWAINETLIRNSVNEKTGFEYEKHPEGFIKFAEKHIEELIDEHDLTLSITPSRLNERLSVQKGKFLFPCNVFKSFEANLCATFKFPFSSLESKNSNTIVSEEIEGLFNNLNTVPSIVKINFSRNWYTEAIRDLHSMNIDAASLFPGLEGFARSLTFTMLRADYKDMGG